MGRAVGIQRRAVGQHHVEDAVRGDLLGQRAQRICQFRQRRHGVAEAAAQLLQQIAKCQFAIGGADRAVLSRQCRAECLEVAIVRKHPVAAPHFAHEGMAVFQRHMALRGLADMGNHILRLDRALLDQARDRRRVRRLVVDKVAHAGAFEKGDAPAVIVIVSAAAARGETREAEDDVGRDVAVHSK